MFAVDTWLYSTPAVGIVATAVIASAAWCTLAMRYKKIAKRLEELSQRQEWNASQITQLPQLLENRTAATIEQGWRAEFRRMMGDVLAVGFQLYAVERARQQHPEIDTRIVGQLKDRGITLVSRIWLFVERDDALAQDLVSMLRNWILEPKPERYAEWERRAYHLAQDVIRGSELRRADEMVVTGNFAGASAK